MAQWLSRHNHAIPIYDGPNPYLTNEEEMFEHPNDKNIILTCTVTTTWSAKSINEWVRNGKIRIITGSSQNQHNIQSPQFKAPIINNFNTESHHCLNVKAHTDHIRRWCRPTMLDLDSIASHRHVSRWMIKFLCKHQKTSNCLLTSFTCQCDD